MKKAVVLLLLVLLVSASFLKGQSPLMRSVSQERTDIWKDFGIRGNFLGVSADGSIFTWFIDGINRSQDEGASWEVVLGEVGEDFSTFAFDINENNRVFVFCLESQTVFYSDDNGDSWQQTSPVPQVLSSNNPADLWSPTNDIIVGLDRTQSGNALFWTVDGGATWDFSVLDFGCEGGVVNDVLVNAQGDVFVAFSNDGLCQNEGIFHSTLSDMQNWTLVAFDHAAVRQLLFHPDGSIVAGNFGGSMSGFHHEPGFYLFDAMADEVAISDNGVVYRLQFHQEWGPTGMARLAFSTDHGEHFYEIGQGIYAAYIFEDMRDGSLFKGRDNYLYVCSQERHKKSVITADEIPSIPMILTWTDIVTEQPEGYVVDANGNVHIYSAEGLAWLSVLSNGLHGQEADNFEGKTIFLQEDIDLAGFPWHPIATNHNYLEGLKDNSFYFKGVFDGKGHVIDNMVLVKDFYISHFGLFGNVVHGEIRNLVLKNSRVNIGGSFYVSVLAYSIEDNSFVANCIVHCLYFRAKHGGLFNNILSGSSVVNCMIHYDYCKEGGGIGEINWGTILNCASITDTLCWHPHGCPGVLFANRGLVKNCYSYLGALWDFPGYSGYAPRMGIAADNDGGVAENCYYNRMPEDYLFDDEPGDAGLDGVFQDVSSFDRDGASWWLTNPVHIGTNPAVACELVDALNYWVDNQFDSYNYLRWGIDNTGVNYGLPVFSDFGFMETLEQENNDEVLFYPNPVNSVVYVKSKDILCVNLFNTDGRRINSLGTVENRETVSLDLVGLKPGLYFLETINNEGFRIIKKVVKQ